MLPFIEIPEEAALGYERKESDAEGRADEGQPEPRTSTPDEPRERESHKGADHIERAVRDVRNAQDAQDKSQTRGYDEEDDRAAQAHENLGQHLGRNDRVDNFQTTPLILRLFLDRPRRPRPRERPLCAPFSLPCASANRVTAWDKSDDVLIFRTAFFRVAHCGNDRLFNHMSKFNVKRGCPKGRTGRLILRERTIEQGVFVCGRPRQRSRPAADHAFSPAGGCTWSLRSS